MKIRSIFATTLGVALMWQVVTMPVAYAEGDNKGAFRFEISGETLEELEIKVVPIREIDRSSPGAVVETYLAYMHPEAAEVGDTEVVVNQAMGRSMASYEEALLTEDLLNSTREWRAKANDDDDADEDDDDITFRYEGTEHEVTGVETSEAGTATVTVTSTRTYSQRDWESGEWETREETERTRFTCVVTEDGSWRVSKVELYTRDWMAEEESYHWERARSSLSFLYMELIREQKSEPAEPKQDTAEHAAHALVDYLVPLHDRKLDSFFSRAATEWVNTLESFLSPDYVEHAKAQAQPSDEFEEEEHKFEIDSVTEGEDGIVHVRFKARSEWEGAIEVRVVKVGDVWKIAEVGRHEQDWDEEGNTVHEYRAVENIYAIGN
jgi:hypothetical protein